MIQKAVEQSPQTAQLNPTSLNCFRVTSLLINNKCTTHNVCLKIGGGGSNVDNLGLDCGGVIVGVGLKDGEFGKLKEVGYDVHLNQLNSSAIGFKFGGLVIDGFDKVVNMALEMHKRIPNCAICGWDIALDKNEEPVLIEANLNCPGVFVEQLCSGPAFGDRTSEVIEYLKIKKDVLKQIYW